MARWSNTHCPNAVYWLGLAGWQELLTKGEGKWLVSRYFLGNDRLEKNNKVAGYQLRHSTPVVVVTVLFFPFQ